MFFIDLRLCDALVESYHESFYTFVGMLFDDGQSRLGLSFDVGRGEVHCQHPCEFFEAVIG